MAEALTNKVRAMVELEETSYDTTPSGAGTGQTDSLGFNPGQDGILLFDNADIIALDTATVEINPLTGVFTKKKVLIGRQLWNFTGQTYLQGGGAASTPVRFNDLLVSCALSQTIGSSSVVYTPISTGYKSCRIAVDVDGLTRYMTGVYGSFTMSGSAGQGIQVSFNHQGIYQAAPGTSPSFSGFASGSNTPVVMKSANLQVTPYSGGDDATASLTTAWTTNTSGNPLVFKSFNFDRGVQLGERLDANAASGMRGIAITDAAPTLELVVESKTATGSGVPDFWGQLASAISQKVTFAHGATAGNIWEFTFPFCQITNIQEGSGDSGIRNWTISYRIQHYNDNAEFTLLSK